MHVSLLFWKGNTDILTVVFRQNLFFFYVAVVSVYYPYPSYVFDESVNVWQALNDIKLKWDDLSLDIGPYKERGHFRLK